MLLGIFSAYAETSVLRAVINQKNLKLILADGLPQKTVKARG